MKTTIELINIASTGASIKLHSKGKTTLDLISIVSTAGKKGGHITIVLDSVKTTLELISIAGKYGNHVTFDFTEIK